MDIDFAVSLLESMQAVIDDVNDGKWVAESADAVINMTALANAYNELLIAMKQSMGLTLGDLE